MARSTYIYVLIGQRSGRVMGAWTVKHELASVLACLSPDRRIGYRVERWKDGKPQGEPVVMDLTSILMEG